MLVALVLSFVSQSALEGKSVVNSLDVATNSQRVNQLNSRVFREGNKKDLIIPQLKSIIFGCSRAAN